MGCGGCGQRYKSYQVGRRRMLQRRAVKKVIQPAPPIEEVPVVSTEAPLEVSKEDERPTSSEPTPSE